MKFKPSYNYCGICGSVPKSNDEPNRAPVKWWDPDDGWKIGTLCRWCAEEVLDQKPKPSDYAYEKSDVFVSESNTDEDETMVLS